MTVGKVRKAVIPAAGFGTRFLPFTERVPKELPILVTAGHEDPVGAYGKGPKEVYAHLRATGHSKTDMNLYKDDRHEIHNETDRQTVYEDLVKFFNKAIAK